MRRRASSTEAARRRVGGERVTTGRRWRVETFARGDAKRGWRGWRSRHSHKERERIWKMKDEGGGDSREGGRRKKEKLNGNRN